MNKARILKYLAHPVFMSAVVAIMALPLVSRLFPKHVIRISHSNLVDKPEGRMLWHDLNRDGESEQLVWFVNSENKATIKVIHQSGFLIDQQVYDGTVQPTRHFPVLYEKEREANPWLICFFYRRDSLFLQGISYSNEFEKEVGKEIYVASLSNHPGIKDFDIGLCHSVDTDGDDSNEFVFSIYGGYPVYPRSIFIYNGQQNQMIHSEFVGGHTSVSSVFDREGDGKKELTLFQYAPGNMPDSFGVSPNDHEVRLLVLNGSLEPIFEPYVLPGIYGGLSVYPFKQNGTQHYVALYFNVSDPSTNGIVLVFSGEGKLLRQKQINPSQQTKTNYHFLEPAGESHFTILDEDGYIRRYDFHLKEVGVTREEMLTGCHLVGTADIDEDGELEKLFGSDELVITRKDFRDGVKLDIPGEMIPLLNGFHVKKNIGKPDELAFQSRNRYFLVAYGRNPWFPFRYLIWLTFFGLTYGFIFLVQYLQSLSLKDRYNAERKVSELQLLLLRNQISPHFLFNAINSINYWIMVKNPVEANNSIVRLSRLIRSNLVSSDRLSRSLKEEVDAVTTYLEIVCSQLDEPFAFQIITDKESDLEIQVPVLVIQNYVENAVKHGVRSMGRDGRIDIEVQQDEKNLFIMISDNGIGRQMADQVSDKPYSTGRGTGLMHQFFDILNKYNVQKISVEITDLEPENEVQRGTRVKITIPVTYKYRIYD